MTRDPHVFEFGEQFAPRPSVEEPATPVVAAPIPSRVETTPASNAAPVSTGQLIRDLKARLRVVEREIKARRALEKEREQIRRLLKAAKLEKATVHAIKRVAV